jgi:hypothetical protein
MGPPTTPGGESSRLVGSDSGSSRVRLSIGCVVTQRATGSLHLDEVDVGPAPALDSESDRVVRSTPCLLAVGYFAICGSTSSLRLDEPDMGSTPSPDA